MPLDLALKSKQESIAKNLVKNHIEINKTDSNGLSLLHKAIQRGKLNINRFEIILFFWIDLNFILLI